MKKIRIPVFLAVMIFPCGCIPATGQVNEQLWFEYLLNTPFADSWNLENAFTYSTLLNTPRWRALDWAPTLEYSITQNFDLMVMGTVSYTKQNESYNTLELRPAVGTRIHFTPNNRILIRLLLRYEQRNLLNLESDTWDQSYRPRVRFETIFPINQPSYYRNELWYAIGDAEILFNGNRNLEERFANRARFRVGLGYRFTTAFRIEFLYMLQKSRNGIDENFESSDNIFRFRLKHYLMRNPDSRAGGVGN
jgi:hypothetical protein